MRRHRSTEGIPNMTITPDSKPRTVMLVTKDMQAKCFSEADLARIEAVTELQPAQSDELGEETQVRLIAGAGIAVTGWGTGRLTTTMLDAALDLELVCHSAGSVRHLIDPDVFVERGIRICSARSVLATGVAEFTFGMMLVSMKAVWQLTAATSNGTWDRDAADEWFREPYGAVVGIVGASHVGREMVRLCKTLELEAILVYDPYLTDEEAKEMGVVKVELDDLMRRSDVVSLHTPAIEECRHIINTENLALMKDHAIFINTARGMCVDEQALIAELETGRILACIDVTDPEPPKPDSPLFSLPNCILTPHVAGAVKQNVYRQGRLVADQIEAFLSGSPMDGEIDLTQHDRLA